MMITKFISYKLNNAESDPGNFDNNECCELIICCYNMYIKELLSPKVILGYELIAKMMLIC